MLQTLNITKSFGDRLLFADVSLSISEGEKVGLIAPNGAGKSTFLNIIAGIESPDSGSVVFERGTRIGYLTQTPAFREGETILDFSTPEPLSADDFDAPGRAKRMLHQFGITDLSQPMDTLSGGQLKRAALVKVLLEEPDFLILDEPTNHLDIEVIEWLEDYLGRKRVTLLLVTHDRYFLDRVCNRIIELDRKSLYSYDGNYDYYLRRREERMEALDAELARVKNILRTELEWMRRQPQARGSKAKYRIDNFHQLEERSRVNLSTREVDLAVKSSYIGSKIFEARNVSKSFGSKCILRDWSYDFARYDKVGIVGPNGVGKSTFIKLLLGLLQPDSGSFDIGTTVRWGYYSQEGMTGFDPGMKVIDAVRDIAEEVTLDDKTRLSASQFLSKFLFTPETQQKFVGKLSGGERRRLYLATVLMRRPNFLILDEPTNDLDIMTLSILEDYLAGFKGCVIIVSHDRFFLDRIVSHLFVFEGDGKVRDFPGDYSTYRHCVQQQKLLDRAAETQTPKGGAAQAAAAPAASGRGAQRRAEQAVRLTFKEKREMEALETELSALANERKLLEDKMMAGDMAHEELSEAARRIEAIISRTDEAEMRLLELMEKDGQ